MGIRFSSEILIGFAVSSKDVHKPFEEKVPGKFHMEDRFDPKSGAKLKAEKVWDEHPETLLMYKGEDYYMHEGFEELLEELLDCRVSIVGSYPCGDLEYVFHPDMPKPSTAGDDGGSVTFGPSYWMKDIVALDIRLKSLKTRLKKLGIEPGEPEVKLAVTVS